MKDKNHNFDQRFADILSEYIDRLNEGDAPSIEDFLKNYESLTLDLEEFLQLTVFIKNITQVEEISECKQTEIFEKIQAQLINNEQQICKQSSEDVAIDRRPDFLILLLHSMKEIWGKSRLVKLLFLMGKEYKFNKYAADYYPCYAYNYGPFDKAIYEDLEVLKQCGIIEERKPSKKKNLEEEIGKRVSEEKVDAIYLLTPKGEELANALLKSIRGKDRALIDEINDVKSKYGYMSLKELLKYVYKQYPEYAKNSKIKDEILEED